MTSSDQPGSQPHPDQPTPSNADATGQEPQAPAPEGQAPSAPESSSDGKTGAPQATNGKLRIKTQLDQRVKDKIPWVIENLLAKGEQLLLFGEPKVGKSQLAMQLAISVALGKDFMIWPVKTPQKVIYVNLEIGEQMFMRRVYFHVFVGENSDKAMQEPDDNWDNVDLTEVNEKLGDRFAFTDSIRSMKVPIETDDEKTKKARRRKKPSPKHTKDESATIQEWQKLFEEHKPDLIVFDTLSKMHSIEESDNNQVQRLLMEIRKLASLPKAKESTNSETSSERIPITHVIVHHSRKQSSDPRSNRRISPDDIRGGSAIRAEADVILGLGRRGSDGETEEEKKKNRNRILILEARNLREDLFYLEFSGWHFIKVEKPPELTQEDIEEKIKQYFIDKAVFGVSQGEIPFHFNGEKARGPQYDFWARALTDLSTKGEPSKSRPLLLTSKRNFRDVICKGNNNEDYLSKRRKKGNDIYWIPENSPWYSDLKLIVEVQDIAGEDLEPTDEDVQ